MASKPETKVVKEIRKALDINYPGFYFKTHGGPFQMAGLPDIIGLHRGVFIGIEVKCPGKEDTLTQKQINVLGKIKSAGGIAFMSTSPEDTLKKLKGEFKDVKRKTKRRTNDGEGKKTPSNL